MMLSVGGWQDVMVVGEPSLMGGEFGDEDERLITRLENTQYDGANSLDHDPHPFGDSPLAGANSWGGPGAPEPRSAPANTPSSQDSGDKKSPAAVSTAVIISYRARTTMKKS